MAPPSLPVTLSASCVLLREALSPTVILPGGAAISAIQGVAGGDPGAMLDGLLAQVNTGLAPMKPLLDVLAAIMSIKGVLDSIPKLIGPFPDPTAFGTALADLAEKLAALVKLLPQLTVPIMAKSILDTVIAGLRGLRVKIQAMLAAQVRADAATERALLLPVGPARTALLQIASCAHGNLETQLLNENRATGTLNQMIALLNTIIQLVPGLPCIPTLGDTASISEAAIDGLDAVIALLEGLSDVFPSIEFNLPALPEAGEAPC